MDNEFAAKILALYPEFTQIYGPYVQKDNEGRRIICLRASDDTRKTISWPKAMMEAKLGRLLATDEYVDHVNDDPTDDRYDNFQILTPAGNSQKAVVANGRETKFGSFVCPMCGCSFLRRMKYVNGNQVRQNKAGPFCGKSCAGKNGNKHGGAGVAKRKRGST